MITKILKQLGSTNLDKEKVQILKENSENESLKKMLQIVYNPKYNLGITDIQLPTTFGTQTVDEVINELDPLLNAEITGDATEVHLNKIMTRLTEEDAKVLQKIVRKNLQVGVGVITVNTALNNLIPKPPYMRCALYSDKTKSKIQFPCLIQRKMDGQFVNMIISRDKITFLSRTGTEYHFNRDFNELHKSLLNEFGEVVIMGELLYKIDNKIQPREIGNGIINKASENNKTITFEESSNIHIVAWDVVSLQEYNNKKSDIDYKTRFSLVKMIAFVSKGFIEVVETKTINNINEAYEYYKDVISDAELEGVIIKNFKNPWGNKTSNEQLKLKCKFQVELKIIGFNQGKAGSYVENSLGSLKCQSEDGLLITDVGTGLNDKNRDEIWINRDNYLNKIVTVEAHRTIEKDGKFSLILPIFIEIRQDKTEADSLDRILEQERSSRQ